MKKNGQPWKDPRKFFADLFRRLSPREKQIFMISAAILLALSFDKLFWGPVTHQLESLDRQIRSEKTAVARSLFVISQKDRIVAEGQKFLSASAPARSKDEEMSALLTEVENLANRSGVNLLYLKPSSSEDLPGLRKHLATLESESQLEQLVTFFHDIESSKRLMKIQKYTLEPKGKESSLIRCTMTVSESDLT